MYHAIYLFSRPAYAGYSFSLGRLRLSRPGCLVLRQGGLPVRLAERQRQRVTYKLAVLTHKVQTTATPTYLSELVQTHAPPRGLRSSDAPMLVVPCIHTELARLAVAASSTLNSLPADIQLCENILTFKRHLKTHLFKLT